MENIMKYGDFIASIRYSPEDDIFFGKVEGVNGLVVFEGKTTAELKRDFKAAAESYLQMCAEKSIPVFKSYKGSFNVRISPGLHRKADETAKLQGMSLNQLVGNAIRRELEESAGSYGGRGGKRKT